MNFTFAELNSTLSAAPVDTGNECQFKEIEYLYISIFFLVLMIVPSCLFCILAYSRPNILYCRCSCRSSRSSQSEETELSHAYKAFVVYVYFSISMFAMIVILFVSYERQCKILARKPVANWIYFTVAVFAFFNLIFICIGLQKGCAKLTRLMIVQSALQDDPDEENNGGDQTLEASDQIELMSVNEPPMIAPSHDDKFTPAPRNYTNDETAAPYDPSTIDLSSTEDKKSNDHLIAL